MLAVRSFLILVLGGEEFAEAAELVFEEEEEGVGGRDYVGGHCLGHCHGRLGAELTRIDYDKVVARKVFLKVFGDGIHVAVE